jgi:hypothetical protein
MALADSLKPLLGKARAIAGQLGLRPHRVYLRSGYWSGTTTGEGEETPLETEITEHGQPPKVRTVTDERRALADLPAGSIEVGPITPIHSGGGTSVAGLLGSALGDLDTFHLRVVGPQGDHLYRVSSVKSDKALHYTITAKPVSAVP